MTVVDWWPGEYPSPVVEVLAPVSLPARAAVCDPKPTLSCRLTPGLIHPWVAGTTASFRSIQPVTRFELRRPLTTDDGDGRLLTFPEGTVVEQRGYLAEGMCSLYAVGHEFPAECPEMSDDGSLYRRLGGEAAPTRQFFGVPCGAEGRRGWIEVDDKLADRAELTWGTILGYGEVGPANEPQP